MLPRQTLLIHRRAFTLVELLTVIAIISLLAAILFPVFSQAKLSARKIDDLSNVRQIGLATFMYTNDNDDLTPFCHWSNFEAIAARLLPYVKSPGVFASSQAKFPQGNWNVREGCGPSPSCTGYNVMMDPASDCVGAFATSKLGAAKLYADVYFPLDFEWNDSLTQSRQPVIMCTPTGQSSPSLAADDGISLTSGSISSTAKAVLWADFPNSGAEWPGGCVDGNCDNAGPSDFWGTNFKGAYFDGSNVQMVDGHAKYFKYGALHPCDHEICRAGGDQNATDWKAWGFTWASPSVQ